MRHYYYNLLELKEKLPIEVKALSKVLPGARITSALRIVGFFLVLGVVALIFVPWVQTVQGKGRVIAYSPNDRQQTIDAPVEGRISRWHVYEGAHVKTGDPIVDISDIDLQIMERLNSERSALEQRLSAFEKSLTTSMKNLERQKSLALQGLSSQRAVELAELEYAKFQSDYATVAVELAKLANRISRQSNQVILAPRDGTIMRITSPQGNEIVKSGDSLAILVPETTDRAVELYLSGNDIPLVSVGRKVRIQFEGWPAVQFSGWPAAAIGTFAGRVGVIDQSDDGYGKFRIIVFPDEGQQWPEQKYLRQGVRAISWVLLDEVRLGWELWRQFNGFPPTVTNPKLENKAKNEVALQ